MKYNLLELDGTLLKAWELDAEYQEKLFAVFPNEIEKKEMVKEIIEGGGENEFYL